MTGFIWFLVGLNVLAIFLAGLRGHNWNRGHQKFWTNRSAETAARSPGGATRRPGGSAPRRWRDPMSARELRLAAGPSFERSEILQTSIDIGALVFGLLFVVVTSGAIVGSFALLLFYRG